MFPLKLAAIILITTIATFVWPRFPWTRFWLRTNFQSRDLPIGFGLVPSFAFILLCLCSHGQGLASAATLILITAIGLVDDVFGNADNRGLRGHIRALWAKKITTGLCKMFVCLVVSVSFSFFTYGMDWSRITVLTLLIAGLSNVFNLLDLRPGRCQFVAIVLLGIIQLYAWSVLGIIGMMVLLITYRPDAQGKVMMGDCGSTTIGAFIALSIQENHGSTGMLLFTTVGILLNLAAERWSFTRLIADSTWLSGIDRKLGVR